jgi:ketosteroid isomerase-like protein
MNNRLAWGLQKTADDGWKVVHEHSSAPAQFETRKVELQRPPSG